MRRPSQAWTPKWKNLWQPHPDFVPDLLIKRRSGVTTVTSTDTSRMNVRNPSELPFLPQPQATGRLALHNQDNASQIGDLRMLWKIKHQKKKRMSHTRKMKLRETSKEDKPWLTFSSVSHHELLGSHVCLFRSM